MDDNNQGDIKRNFDLPYAIAVECETSIRQKLDFWRLRTLAIVLRQSPKQIKNFEGRYEKPLN